MTALQKWQDALHHVAEGWRQLKERTESAMTRFRPDQQAPQNRDDDTLWRQSMRWSLMASDIAETDKAFDIRLEAPGMNREDFTIDVQGNEVRISGVKRWQSRESKTHFHRIECAYGSFERQFTLPSAIEQQEVRAHYRDGVLTLHLPKKSTHQGRKIAITN